MIVSQMYVVWCCLVMVSDRMEVAHTPEEPQVINLAPPHQGMILSAKNLASFFGMMKIVFRFPNKYSILLSPQLFSACGGTKENTQQKKRQYRFMLIYDQKKLIALSNKILNAIKGISFNEFHCL